MPSQSSSPPEVFISYSHLDGADYKDELVKQLNILQRQGVISNWHDGLLVAGEQWSKEIIERLNSSRIILLLISPDFMNSDYIYNVELRYAAERHAAGTVTIIPVLARNVNSWENEPFGNLKLGDFQALPSGARFIVEWELSDKAFADVARGIQRAVEKLSARTVSNATVNPLIPAPPRIDFVRRKDREGRYIVERLKTELAGAGTRLIVLNGQGGVGKTTIAAEVARSMTSGWRIVWTSTVQRADFTFSTLLDEIAAQLGDTELLKLAIAPKEASVVELIAAAPTFIVLDNLETIPPAEQARCAEFLKGKAPCPSLITTRQTIRQTRTIPVDSMSPAEAQEFLEKLVGQMQDPDVFSMDVRGRIIETADARPYIMQWVVAQIDQEAQEPDTVFEELSRGDNDIAERVFDRSFNLPQLGDDGRAALLALTLFKPSASRPALAEVAGFGDDIPRLNKAIASLRALLLISGVDAYRRLTVESLTRSLARARLLRDDSADKYRQRFVACFLSYVEAHAQPTPEDYDALEAEKDNALNAMDLASALKDWESVQRLASVLAEPVDGMLSVHGYWDEALQRCEQAAAAAQAAGNELRFARFTGDAATIRKDRGEYEEARRTYQQVLATFRNLNSEENVAAILHQLAMIAQELGEVEEAQRLYTESLEIAKRLDKQNGIAITLHQLAILAQDQREVEKARQLYTESLEIKKKLGNQRGIAGTLHDLATLAQELGEAEEARRLYTESLEIKKKLGNQHGIAVTLGQLGLLAESEGNKSEAAQLLREALSIFEKLKSPHAKLARQSLTRVEGESS